MPKFSGEKSETQERDVVAVLSSDGAIYFYRYPFDSYIPVSFAKSL